MYKVTLNIKPALEEVERIIGKEIRLSRDGYYTLLEDLGYSREEISYRYNIKSRSIIVAKSRFKKENPEYRLRSVIYREWRKKIYYEAIKPYLDSKEFYKLNFDSVVER